MQTILVCDDDKEIVEAIQIYLEQEGYEVLTAYDGMQALQQIRQNQIDGVVYMVPENDMQAVEGSYFIKKALEDAGIPVLAFNADPVDPGKWNAATMTEMVEQFIETRIIGKEKQ